MFSDPYRTLIQSPRAKASVFVLVWITKEYSSLGEMYEGEKDGKGGARRGGVWVFDCLP